VRTGTPATITLAERPGVKIIADVARVSGELDPKSRKMLTELDVDNSHGEIVPGSFVEVHLAFPSPSQPQAPVEALVVRGGKTFVATVDDASRVHFAPVVVGLNDGRAVTFTSGATLGERVALNLGGAVNEGDRVQVDASSATTPGVRASATAVGSSAGVAKK
jgi:membrane fusion protein (multidrug efflux system)